METIETPVVLDEAVVQELGVEDSKEGRIFIVKDEADLLQEEQELELQEVQVGCGRIKRGGGGTWGSIPPFKITKL